MSANDNAAREPDPRIRCADIKPAMAKAALPDLTLRERRAEYGQILRRASELAGFNRDETADALQVDKSQVSRWWSGDENPQTFRYRDHPRLRIAYLKAQAEKDASVTVETIIRIAER